MFLFSWTRKVVLLEERRVCFRGQGKISPCLEQQNAGNAIGSRFSAGRRLAWQGPNFLKQELKP